MPAADLPHTAVLTIRTEDRSRSEVRPDVVYSVTDYFRRRYFLVAFQRPNVLVVSGGYRALLHAVANISHEPWRHSLLLEATLCAGAWQVPTNVSM